MRKNVSIKDVEIIKEIVEQKQVVDFFKSWLDLINVDFYVTKSLFDTVEVKCRYCNQKVDYQDKYIFIVDLKDRSNCKVSALLEGLYSSDDIDSLLQFTRLLTNQISSHFRLIESKEN